MKGLGFVPSSYIGAGASSDGGSGRGSSTGLPLKSFSEITCGGCGGCDDCASIGAGCTSQSGSGSGSGGIGARRNSLVPIPDELTAVNAVAGLQAKISKMEREREAIEVLINSIGA